MRFELEAFVRSRLARWDVSLAEEGVGATLARELVPLIVSPGERSGWRRRPSISSDGTPVILSWKIGRTDRDELRLLVEPGNLGMTVAQQIAFSLTRLDRLLDLLEWGSAKADLNAITAQVFPPDCSETNGWWGGVWIGASILPSLSDSFSSGDLRLYLNLRYGNAVVRWRKLAALISSFVSPTLAPVVNSWLATVSLHAIPVGLGVVIADGRVGAIRAYVGVHNPTLESLSVLSSPLAGIVPRELVDAYSSFTYKFGSMRPQAVTVGYDFVRDMTGSLPTAMGRVKVDVCCHLIPGEQKLILASWIAQCLAAWSFESCSLATFLEDLQAVWADSEVQFVSLGFAPTLDHITVYVKPCV